MALAPADEFAEEWNRDRPACELGNVPVQVGLIYGRQPVMLVYGYNPIALGYEALVIAGDYPMTDDGRLASGAKDDDVPDLQAVDLGWQAEG